MKKTTICSLLISLLFFSSCLYQSHAHNKQTQALDNLYRTKWSSDSAIDTSRFKVPEDVKTDCVLPQEGLKEKDKIFRLPGQPFVRFDQYGGYVTVSESGGRAFYYYFVEAEQSKESLPLLLWLNGGPGCSSLSYGAMQELGPFRVNSDGKTLHKNKFSWNHEANVLFVESPAGVGFSYSNISSYYNNSCGDEATAKDNYVFVLNWLERFPEYKDRDFYIAGESYAGHYVPQLAHTILYHNKMANKTLINLKGILIGNAVINDATDNLGMYDFFHTHALISDATSDQIHKVCDFNVSKPTDECKKATAEADRVFDYKLYIYGIYAPLCLNKNLTFWPKRVSDIIDPCSEAYTYAYMNREDVQAAMHANVTKLDHDWQSCSDIIQRWHDSPSTIIPLLKEFMANNLRVWVFSGDTDGRVPVTSTRYSINLMNLPIKTQWHPWLYQGEMGGFEQVYEGDLTFATVFGAGHMVPSDKPKNALALFKHFLAGKPLDDSRK